MENIPLYETRFYLTLAACVFFPQGIVDFNKLNAILEVKLQYFAIVSIIKERNNHNNDTLVIMIMM